MEPTSPLAEIYPDLADVFDFIIKSRGLKEASELTPEFLKKCGRRER